MNVLKVQHHGALANVEAKFVKRVTADHYVFCGNGAHHNPEIEVVEAFAKARLTGIDSDGPVGPAAPFKFWFTSSPETPDSTASQSRRAHMKAVKRRSPACELETRRACRRASSKRGASLSTSEAA